MEDYPRARPDEARMTTIKVSLDEWATARRGANAELMTDGLAGCVAVAVRTDDRVALTHVYSDALDRFDSYKDQIRDFVASVGGRDAIRELHLVDNGNPIPQGQNRNLTGMIEDHLVAQGTVHADRVRTHIDNGCTVGNDGFYLKGQDNPALYIRGYTNTLLEQIPDERREALAAALQRGVFADSRGNPQPSDIDAPPRNAQQIEAHTAQARYVDPPPQQAASQPVAEPPPDPRVAMVSDIASVLRQQQFGMNASPLARSIADQAQAQGISEIARTDVNRQEVPPRITIEGNGRTLEFDAEGRTATLRPQVQPAQQQAAVAQPLSLYEQSYRALEPHVGALSIQSDAQRVNLAREIASQAQSEGMTGISRVALDGQGPQRTLTVHQDGNAPQQSQPAQLDTLMHRAGIEPQGIAAPVQANPVRQQAQQDSPSPLRL
jgi:hypothetical protein